MSVVNQKLSLGIGRRTLVNVLEGKTIRKHKDGGDVFEDYWTDSDEENSNHSSMSSHFFSLSVKSQDAVSSKELLDSSDSDQTEAASELVSGTSKNKMGLSKSGTKISLPVSSSKSFHKSRMSSISFKHSQKSIVRNLDREMMDILQLNSSVDNTKKDELIQSSLPTPNKNSETVRSLEKTHVKTKSSLEMEKILSNYDKYDALIMQMIRKSNDGDNCPEHPAQDVSSKLECPVSELNNDTYLTNTLSLADNMNEEHHNFDHSAIFNTSSKKDKSDEISSLEKKKSLRKHSMYRRNKKSSSSTCISSDKTNSIVKEVQTELNVSPKSLNKSNRMGNKENLQGMLIISNSEKGPSHYITMNKNDSSAVKSTKKSDSLNLFEKSSEGNSFQMNKSSKKIKTKSKSDVLRNISHVHESGDELCINDFSIKKNQNKTNASLTPPEKRKCHNEESFLGSIIKHMEKSSIGNKKQKTAVDKTNSIVEDEHNAIDLQLHMNGIASEQELPYISGSSQRKQNSSNLSFEQEHLNINSNVNELSSQSHNVRTRQKHPIEFKDTEKEFTSGKQKVKSSIGNKKQETAVDETNNNVENEPNATDHEIHMNDIASEQELLSISGCSSEKQNSSNLSPEQEHLDVNSNVNDVSQGHNVRTRQKHPIEFKDTEKEVAGGKQRRKSQSSNQHGKQIAKSSIGHKKQKIVVDETDNTVENEFNSIEHELQTAKSSIGSKKQKIAVGETNNNVENEPNATDHELHMNDIASEQELLSISGCSSEKQNSSNLSPEQEHLNVNSNVNDVSQGHNVRTRQKHPIEFKDTEKEVAGGKQRRKSQSSNHHGKQIVKSSIGNKKQKIVVDETNNTVENEFNSIEHELQTAKSSIGSKQQKIAVGETNNNVENEPNATDHELHMNDIASEQELLSISGCSSEKQNSSNLSPEQEHLNVNSNVNDVSQGHNVRTRQKHPIEFKDTEKEVAGGKQRRKSQSSNHHGKQIVKSSIGNKKQKIVVDETNNTVENEFNSIEHELQTAKSSIGSKKQKITVGETNNNVENEPNATDHELHMNDIASEQELLSISGCSSEKQNSSNLSPEQERLNVNSNVNVVSQGHNVRTRQKHPIEFKDTEKEVTGGKQRRKSQFNSSNHHGKQTSIKNLSVEEESVSDDNYSSSRSKRKQLLESSKSKMHSSGTSFDNPHSLKKNVSKKQTPAKSAKHRKKSYSKEQVRRSSRERYAPLARWRNERLLYRFEKGEIKILGIDKGIEDDANAAQQIERMYRNKRKQKKENIPRIKKTKIFDTKLQKEVSTNVYKAFQSIPWVGPHSKTESNAYRIKRIFETNNSAFGYLEIDGFEKKPAQHMPEEDLQLTVVEGEVEIIIQENSFKPQKRDMFIIPRGIPYSIININKRKALLSFSVGKFKLLEKGLVN